VVTLVFPREADMGQRRISLFSPLGAALLGRRRGETVRYAAPGGEIEVRILDIVYQPEAAGRYDV
jgi:regulator of nucleoside diphosphate kinase